MCALTALVRISQFLKPLMALQLCVATAASARPTTEGPAPEERMHVEGDDAPTVADDRVIRLVNFDLCWPASDDEYRALGKHAILMLTASSNFATDLPLTSAYIETDESAMPLQRIALFNASQAMETPGAKKAHWSQVSFYLLPIHLTKRDARLLVDFTGQRKAFGVTSFSKAAGLDQRLPEFLHRDQDDSPGEANMKVLRTLLIREYPDYFPRESAKPDGPASAQSSP
jgi:hypothetical protein